MDKDKQLPECKFGAECYRKNSEHLLEFWHPPRIKEIVAPATEPLVSLLNGTKLSSSLLGRVHFLILIEGACTQKNPAFEVCVINYHLRLCELSEYILVMKFYLC